MDATAAGAKLVLGNRFFERDPGKAASALARLGAYIARMAALDRFARIVIAVNVAQDRSGAVDYLRQLNLPQVLALEVQPWGRFMPALDAVLRVACEEGAQGLLFASTEVWLDAAAVDCLRAQVDATTLVAGLCLEGHDFAPGRHACTGSRSPWNTAALWRIPNGLDRIGFPALGEAWFSPDAEQAGMEEVGAIAVLQSLYGDCDARLVAMAPGHYGWDTAASSQPRQVAAKIASKNARAAAQCLHAQVAPGRVLHLRCP
jgi:hypothetical protein